jgi:hypothetical protein
LPIYFIPAHGEWGDVWGAAAFQSVVFQRNSVIAPAEESWDAGRHARSNSIG